MHKQSDKQQSDEILGFLSVPGRRIALGIAAIALMTAIAYIPAMLGGYVWDDDMYVTKNELLRAPDGLWRIWFSLDSLSQYFPLVYTVFRVEYSLWGLNPLGYHIVNVALHIMNALLIWLILSRLKIRGAWLAAAIFALHPVQVESVAWITERKNTLSTVLYLASLLTWMRFSDKERAGHPWTFYALSIVFFALALLAKTTAVTLPAALLLVLYIRGQKIDRGRLLQMVPYVLLGIAMGLVTIWWEQHHQGTTGAEFAFTPLERTLMAGRALWFYLGKLVWPSSLIFGYPKWEILAPVQYVWLAACMLTAGILWWKRRVIGRGPIAAGIFYMATLSPMLGFISLYTLRYTFVADHYVYLACVGPIAVVTSLAGRLKVGRARFYVAVTLVLGILGLLTWRQGYAYKDLETFWRHTLAAYPGSWFAHNNLGVTLAVDGRLDEAEDEFAEALRINPAHMGAHYNLATLLVSTNRADGAVQHFEAALRANRAFVEAHYELARILVRQGRTDEAVGHYKEAVRIRPDYAKARQELADLLARQGKADEAAVHYEALLETEPNSVRAHRALAGIRAAQGDSASAIEHFSEVVKLDPDDAEAHYNLGSLLGVAGRIDEEIEHYREALRINPKLAEAHGNLAVALYYKGRYREAWDEVELCRRYGARPNPDFVRALSGKLPR